MTVTLQVSAGFSQGKIDWWSAMALYDCCWSSFIDLWYIFTLPTCKNKHISNLIPSVKGSPRAGRFSAFAASHVAEKQR